MPFGPHFLQLFRTWARLTAGTRKATARRQGRRQCAFDILEQRVMPAVTITPSAAFAVDITANEIVSIFDNAGFVTVNVNGADTSTATPSDSVTSITVTATGLFDNQVDLSRVTNPPFTALTPFNALHEVTITISTSEALNVNGNDGADVFSVKDLAGVVDLTTTLRGGSGDDVFRFADAAGVTGRIDGGAGANTLDFSDYTTPVVVDLAGATATNVGAGIANIENFLPTPLLPPSTDAPPLPRPLDTPPLPLPTNVPPANVMPRRVVVPRRRTRALPLAIRDRDAGRIKARVTLTAGAGRLILDRALLRRLRGVAVRGNSSRRLTLTGDVASLNRLLKTLKFQAPLRGRVDITMTTNDLSPTGARIDRDIIRVLVS
jgi:hypothetical protein